MTIIQPHQKSFLNVLLIITCLMAVFAASSLIFLYNRWIDADHNISRLTAEIQKIQAQGAELQDKIFAFSSSENLNGFLKTNQLFKDQQPRYLEVRVGGVNNLPLAAGNSSF